MSDPVVALYKPYCTLAEVQKEARNTDVIQEQWFKACINSASRAIEDFTKKDFWFHNHASSPLSVKRKWCIGETIFLPWPIISLTAVTENGNVIDPSEYYFEEGSGKIERISSGLSEILSGQVLSGQIPGSFVDSGLLPTGAVGNGLIGKPTWSIPGGSNTLTLTGTFGYALADPEATDAASPTLPATLRRSCVLLASNWSRKAQREIVSTDGTNQSLSFYNIPEEVVQFLAMHRAVVL